MNEQFDRILEHTLSDYRVSRGERRVLRSVVDEIDPDDQQLATMRHRAFEIARREVGGPEAHAVIGWLEDVVKVLQARSGDATKSPAAYFSPGSGCVNAVVGLLRQTRKTADICVFTITDNRIADAIVDASQRRVDVRIISDNDKAEDPGSDIARLRGLGLPVRVDRTDNHMHHKYAIFDKSTLVTGSYNWTRSAADCNEENLVVQYDRSLIRRFGENFEKLWNSLDSM
jgi:phosphatidylserine/phosphatidylglycerophosphate/cardiolipin synthase-like enzyme